jgi:hypothetical protein
VDEGPPSNDELDVVASNAIAAHEAGRGCIVECVLDGAPETCSQYEWARRWQAERAAR